MASTTSSDVRALVDSFVDDLSGLIRAEAMGSIQRLLGGEIPVPYAPARRGRPAKAGKKRGRPVGSGRKSGKRIRRSAEDLDSMAASIKTHVQANPGARLEQISAGIGESSKDLKRPVQMLLAAGQLRTEGQKRGTMYFSGSGKATRKRGAKKAEKRKGGTRRKR